jgi:hypothetical protein
MFATALPRVVHALAQPAVLAAGVATGVGVGAVGIGTGAIPVTDGGQRLTAIYECPDSNRIVARVAQDQKALITARSSDGTWLQIYLGQPDADRGWARTGSVTLPSPLDALPVADCLPGGTSAPETAAPPTGEPSAAPLTGAPNPGGGPTLSHLNIVFPAKPGSGGRYVIGCNGEPAAVIEVDASDPDGVAQVILVYSFRFQQTPTRVPMEHQQGNRWQASILASGGQSPGQIDYGVGALDNLGNSALLFFEQSPSPQPLDLC